MGAVMRLKDKVSIVTGSSTGIGLAIAALFAQEGAKVVINCRTGNGERAVDIIKQKGGEASCIKGDVSSPSDAERIVKETVKKYGKLDILVNNAAIAPYNNIENTSEQLWDRTLATNLKGAYLMSKNVIPELKKSGGGVIINTASIAGLIGYQSCIAYDASKGGILSFTRALAVDLGRAGTKIRVNAICPGEIIWSDWGEPFHSATMVKYMEDLPPKEREASLKEMIRRHPIGRIGKPEDIAYAALYLASDEASFVNGTHLVVDGGYIVKDD
jgi:NAD(P)-dependent dehydrogenase (short-subunit alcohol dehydrogenase family)